MSKMQKPVGRISHVQLVYPADQLDAVCAQLTSVLGIEEWDRFETPGGTAVAVNLAAGIEICAPLNDENPFAEVLRTRGPGVETFVFGVDNLDEGIARAAAAGVEIRGAAFDVLAFGAGHLPEQFAVLKEAQLERFAGLDLRLGEIEPR